MTWMPNIVSPVTPTIMFKLYQMLHIHLIQDTILNNGHGMVIILDPLKITEILDLNEKFPGEVTGGGSNGNQKAAAHIMMAYYYLNITDRWGYAPYSEALKVLLILHQNLIQFKNL